MPPHCRLLVGAEARMAFPSQNRVACFGHPPTPTFSVRQQHYLSASCGPFWTRHQGGETVGIWGPLPWHAMLFWWDPVGGTLTSLPCEEQPGQGVPPRGRVCEDRAGCLMHYLQDQVDTLTFQSQSLRDRARRFEEALRKNTEEQLEVPRALGLPAPCKPGAPPTSPQRQSPVLI